MKKSDALVLMVALNNYINKNCDDRNLALDCTWVCQATSRDIRLHGDTQVDHPELYIRQVAGRMDFGVTPRFQADKLMDLFKKHILQSQTL